jgi:6-phosphogluconolactonase
MPQIHIAPDSEHLAQEAASFIHHRIHEKLEKVPQFSLVLAGGNTPVQTYQRLASMPTQLDWSRVHFFWGDERCVPHDHPDSNYRMALEMLLSHLPVPLENIHSMSCNPSPEEGARSYEDVLRRFFPAADVPQFDLILLGLGGDGHTASLFPDTRALDEHERWVAANWVEKLDTWRLTLTLPALNAAAAVAFLVQGSGKASIVQAALAGPPARLPAQHVSPEHGDVHWFLDRAAAAELPPGSAVTPVLPE